MNNTLDFNKIKKQYLTVTLADENKTVIMIGTPTKSIMNIVTSLYNSLDTLSDDEIDVETMSDIYDAVAKIMSRNKTNKKIEKEYLEEIFDFEDIIIFINAYMEFITALADQKN